MQATKFSTSTNKSEGAQNEATNQVKEFYEKDYIINYNNTNTLLLIQKLHMVVL